MGHCLGCSTAYVYTPAGECIRDRVCLARSRFSRDGVGGEGVNRLVEVAKLIAVPRVVAEAVNCKYVLYFSSVDYGSCCGQTSHLK